MDLYAENILDHYRHPRGKKILTDPTVTHEEKNLSCGDECTLHLVIENNRITHVGWEGTGCAISQAAISMLSEELAGMSFAEASALSPVHMHELLGVPVGPRRTKCALLGLHTLKNALRMFENKPSQGWAETIEGT